MDHRHTPPSGTLDQEILSDAAKQESVSHGPVGQELEGHEERLKNRRINRKLDFALLPILSLLYLFNGLDRGNVGNAQTQGFTTDIGASPNDLNFAVSIFYVTFVVFQPISSAIGRRVGPKYWMPFIMFIWGIITLSQAWIHGRGSLLATRLLIGAFEAGFYPTAVSYLSTFYTRYDLAVRVGLFYGQYAVAGAFSSAIAYGVFQLTNGPLQNWQYLFIIEGTLTSFMAVIALIWLPATPGSAWFLSAEDRVFASERIRLDNSLYVQHRYKESGVEEDRLTRRDVIETVKDWKLWGILVFNICASVPSTAFSVFLPLVVEGLGYSSLNANLMSVPPYLCGAAGLYLFALSSDRFKERGLHAAGGIFIAIIGLIIVVTVPTSSNTARYIGLCIFLFGSYVSSPLTVAWLAGNTPEPGKRFLVLGVNGWGNLAGVIGSELYVSKYAPRYLIPFYATLGFVIVAFLGYIAYRFGLAAVNKRRLRRLAGMSEADIEQERMDETRYADRKYTFIYGL